MKRWKSSSARRSVCVPAALVTWHERDLLRAIATCCCLLGLLGCSSRVTFVEPPDATPAAFTCATIEPAPHTEGDCLSCSVERDADAAGPTDDRSTTDGSVRCVDGAPLSNTSTPDHDGAASVNDGGASSDATTGQPSGDTCTHAVDDAQSDDAEFQCKTPPCVEKGEPCPCYVESACERGEPGCSGVAVWSITVDQAELDYIHTNYREDKRIPVTLCADSTRYEGNIEIQGASSRGKPKKNYNLRFDKNNELPGKYLGTTATIDKLVLKAMATDRTLVRETLAFDLWRDMGYDAPYSGGLDGFVQLVINGRFHGLYSRVEPVDRDYLRRRGMATNGRLYKGVRRNGGFADFRPGRNLNDAFEDKTTPDDPDYTVLKQLVNVIQDDDLSSAQFFTEIKKYVSLEQIMDRMVWVSFTQNGDAVAQNFFLYHRAEAEPPWHLIPWDSNLCFGADWADPENWLSATAGYLLGGNLLAERLLEHPPFVEAFKQRYSELLNSLFTPEALQERLEPLTHHLSIAMDRDRAMWGYPTDAETAFEGLADFLSRRPVTIADKLSRWP